MEVKTWQPNPDCKQCAQAEKNNRESAASGERIYTSALKESNIRYAENVTLKARVAELEKENNILTDHMMEIRGLVRPIVQNSAAILEEATIPKASEGESSNKGSDL